VHVVRAFSQAQSLPPFPVDVDMVARGVHEIFGWKDAITDIRAADIPGFEGALFPNDDRTKWMLAYNNAIRFPGRIRFTKAHEVGHYILHRLSTEGAFKCTELDMLDWSDAERQVEKDADEFASFLLMPLDDFRKQITNFVDLNMLSVCADRYGVSLTASVLKWLSFTEEKAVVVISSDGFMNWASASEAGAKAGAFFKTRSNVIEVPPESLTANPRISSEKFGVKVRANIWFKHAPIDAYVTEMKIRIEHLGSVLTLIVLPRALDVWPPWDGR
jgi:Zn-dependent peptidase ImmA (M78 family)